MLNSFTILGYQDNFYLNKANLFVKIICMFVFVLLMIINHEISFHIVLLTLSALVLLMTNLSSRSIIIFIVNNLILLIPLFSVLSLILGLTIGFIVVLKLLIISFYIKVIAVTTSKKETINITNKLFGSSLTSFFYNVTTFSNNFIKEITKLKIGYYLKGINYESFSSLLKLKFIYYNIPNVINSIKKHNKEIKENLTNIDFQDKASISLKIGLIDLGMILVHVLLLALIIIRG